MSAKKQHQARAARGLTRPYIYPPRTPFDQSDLFKYIDSKYTPEDVFAVLDMVNNYVISSTVADGFDPMINNFRPIDWMSVCTQLMSHRGKIPRVIYRDRKHTKKNLVLLSPSTLSVPFSVLGCSYAGRPVEVTDEEYDRLYEEDKLLTYYEYESESRQVLNLMHPERTKGYVFIGVDYHYAILFSEVQSK